MSVQLRLARFPFAASIVVFALLAPSTTAASTITLTPPTSSTITPNGLGAGASREDYILALSTFAISSLGIEADFVNGTLVTAQIYSANSSFVQGSLLASSTMTIVDAGFGFYDIPLSFTFTSGNYYSIGFSWPIRTSGQADISVDSIRFFSFASPTNAPFTVAGLVRVLDGGAGHSAGGTNSLTPHLRFDTVDAQAVPEPGTVVTLSMGLVIVGRALWRRARGSSR